MFKGSPDGQTQYEQDIVERLRTQETDLFRLQEEAADTIEALRRERDDLQDKCNNFSSKCRTAIAERDALNLELQKRDKCSYMGPMRDCPTHGESGDLAAMTQERDHYKEMNALHIESLGLKSIEVATLKKMCTTDQQIIADEIADADSKLAAMTAERDAAIKEVGRWSREAGYAQAREAALREALWKAHGLLAKMNIPMISDALDMIHDDTALKAWGAKLLRDAADGLPDGWYEVRPTLRMQADELEQTK
jgi:hypothetical protein